MAESGKKTRGKQKIEMKRIEDSDDRMTTFAKRRSGIYKKANELVTLTGAEVGVLVFSPTGKPYSFAHPSMEAISNRFRGVNPLEDDDIQSLFEGHRKVKIDQLNQYYNELLRQIDTEKEHEETLKEKSKEKESQGWWEAPLNQLSLEELHQMDKNYEELIKNLSIKLNEKSFGSGCASSSSCPRENPPQLRSQFLNGTVYDFNEPNHQHES